MTLLKIAAVYSCLSTTMPDPYSDNPYLKSSRFDEIYDHGLNMEVLVDLKVYIGSMSRDVHSCTHWLSLCGHVPFSAESTSLHLRLHGLVLFGAKSTILHWVFTGLSLLARSLPVYQHTFEFIRLVPFWRVVHQLIFEVIRACPLLTGDHSTLQDSLLRDRPASNLSSSSSTSLQPYYPLPPRVR